MTFDESFTDMTSTGSRAGARWDLPSLQQGSPAPADVIAGRVRLHELTALQRVSPAAKITECTIAGLRCLEVTAQSHRATLIYTHGGGFRLGEPETWVGLASRLAVAADLRVILPAYKLAPEHPFPAALQDLSGIYRALQEESRPLFLGGDSAGGGLAAALALAARDAGAAMPAALMLMSPWLDLTVSARSYDSCAATDVLFSRQAALDAARQYLAQTPATHPLASPLLAPSLAGLPPTWICASSSEVLLGDALAYIDRLVAVGTRVEALIEPRLPHVWPVLQPASREADTAIFAAAQFLRRHIDG